MRAIVLYYVFDKVCAMETKIKYFVNWIFYIIAIYILVLIWNSEYESHNNYME